MTLTTTLFLEFVILVFSFLLQTCPRLKHRYYGIDTWRWLLYADEIRKNQGRLPKQINKYIIEAPFNAPPVLLLLLATFLTRSQAEKINFLINPIFNILENLLLFSFVFILTHNSNAALISSLIFSLTPADLIENSDLNMRSIGKLTFQLAFVGLCLFLWKDSIIFGIFFSFTVALTLLSHRMSTQFLVLVVLLSAAFTIKISLLFYLLLGGLAALAASKGFYWEIAKNHSSILKFWWKNQKWRFANMATGEISKTTLKSSLWIFVKRLLLRNPYLFLSIPFLWAGAAQIIPSSIDLTVKTTILLALTLAILTTFVPFLFFLGEGYRYIGLISFQVAFLIGVQINILFTSSPVVQLLLLLPLSLSVLVMGGWIRKIFIQKNEGVTFSITGKFQEMVQNLNNKNEPYHFMSIPPIADDAIAYFSPRAKVAFHDNGVALLQSTDYYPVIKNLTETVHKYQVNYCFIHKNVVADNKINQQLIGLGKVFFQTEDFLLYKTYL